MKDLVGQRAISAFSILMDGTDTLRELSDEFENAGGSAERMANIQLDTLEGKLTIMMSALSALGISFFKIIDGPLKGLVDGFTSVVSGVDKVVKVFSFQSDETKILTKTMKDHEDAIRGIISANDDLSFQQEESRNIEIQNELNELTKQYVASRDALELYAFEIIRNPDEARFQQLKKNIELESANRDAILETINAKGEDIEASNRRMAALKKEGGGDGEGESFGPTTKSMEIKLSELDQFYIAQHEASIVAQGLELEMQEAHYLALAESDAEYDAIQDIFQEKYKQRAEMKKKIDSEELKQKLAMMVALLNATAGFVGEFAGGAKVAARMQQVAAVINTWSGATAALAPPPIGAGPIAGIPLAATIVTTGLANVMKISKSIGEFKTAATGMDSIVSSPTMILAGEAGAEQVSITPLEGPNIDGPQGGGSITVNVSGNVLSQDFVEGELAENIKEAIRRGTDFGVS